MLALSCLNVSKKNEQSAKLSAQLNSTVSFNVLCVCCGLFGCFSPHFVLFGERSVSSLIEFRLLPVVWIRLMVGLLCVCLLRLLCFKVELLLLLVLCLLSPSPADLISLSLSLSRFANNNSAHLWLSFVVVVGGRMLVLELDEIEANDTGSIVYVCWPTHTTHHQIS